MESNITVTDADKARAVIYCRRVLLEWWEKEKARRKGERQNASAVR